jgi:hypothetical protein
VGEEYVFFLWTSRSGLTQVIGLSQGLFRVGVDASGAPVLVRPAATEIMLSREGRLVQDQPLSMRLTDMKARVVQTLGAAR